MKFKHIFKILAFVATSCFTTISHAQDAEKFICQDNGFVIEVELFEIEHRAQANYNHDSFSMLDDSLGGYINAYQDLSFFPHHQTPIIYIGNNQYLCKTQDIGTKVDGKTIYKNITGMSLGGTLRTGPGTNFPKTGSLRFGDPVDINVNTEVNFNGYDWFKISQGKEFSYQWGGIMCSHNQLLEGIFEQCPQVATTNNTGPFLSLAIGDDGTYGTGLSNIKEKAEALAVNGCRAGCEVDITTTAKCLAYAADTRGGQWIGTGNNIADAKQFAMGHCSNSGAGCSLQIALCN